jgi:hypothetical protein
MLCSLRRNDQIRDFLQSTQPSSSRFAPVSTVRNLATRMFYLPMKLCKRLLLSYHALISCSGIWISEEAMAEVNILRAMVYSDPMIRA